MSATELLYTVRMTKEDREALRQIAEMNGVTGADMIRRWIAISAPSGQSRNYDNRAQNEKRATRPSFQDGNG